MAAQRKTAPALVGMGAVKSAAHSPRSHSIACPACGATLAHCDGLAVCWDCVEAKEGNRPQQPAPISLPDDWALPEPERCPVLADMAQAEADEREVA
jgi:hypothetical protein